MVENEVTTPPPPPSLGFWYIFVQKWDIGNSTPRLAGWPKFTYNLPIPIISFGAKYAIIEVKLGFQSQKIMPLYMEF